MTYRIQHLFLYPVKSLGGYAVENALLDDRGLHNDRRMMLIDHENRFVSQRELAQLALFKTTIDKEQLIIRASGELGDEEFRIDMRSLSGEQVRTSIWSDECDAVIISKKANEYFARLLNRQVKLAYMPDHSRRVVDKQYNSGNVITSFTDGFQMLLIGSASLDDLNDRLRSNGNDEVITWDRFRPNVVVETFVPFEEDNWNKMAVSSSFLEIVKPCSRCVITTIDQQNGIKGKEPLRTLASYRTVQGKVMFGQNVQCTSSGGVLRVGDEILFQ